MHNVEKEKHTFFYGNTQPPTKKDEGYEKWYTDNQKAKRWLLMSMSLEIMKRYIHLPTARAIWKALSTTFYDGADELHVCTLNQKAYSAKQNGRSLSSYYEELIEFLCELDHYDKVIKENEKDASSYHKSIQWQRVHIFLAGLDGEFEQFCREILRKYPIQDLEECYSMVRRESIRHVTVNRDLEKSEAAAMVRKYRSNQYRPDRMRSKGIKSTYKWTHCDQSGYTKDLCFEIMRYPEWWDHNRDLRKRNASKSFVAAIVEINAKEYVDQQ